MSAQSISFRGLAWTAVGVLVVSLAASCASGNTGSDETSTSSSGTGASSGGGGQGGVGGSAGAGGGDCDPNDCEGVDTDCRYRTCVGGCALENAAAGVSCDEDGGQVCDGSGSCLECLSADHCPGEQLCLSNECVPATCANGSLGENETDVDCGGSDCPPCANTKSCEVFSDCQSSFCDTGGGPGICRACISDADCAAATNTWCDHQQNSGSCVPQKVNGDLCDGAGQCLSGFCPTDDGVCCNEACDASCEGCLSSKTGQANGTCALIEAATDPDAECSDAGAPSCGATGAGCSGTLNACILYSAGTECVAPSCSAGQQTTQGSCNGLGVCEGAVSSDCEPYVCGADACLTSCTGDPDCAAGYVCDTGSCVPACGDIVSVSAPTIHLQLGPTQGAWMTDPLETLGPGLIWRLESYTGSAIQRFANLAALSANTPAESWSLPLARDGTGHVVYGGHLYYNKANSPNMVKYDLASKSVVLDVPLAGAGYHNVYDYQWGGYSDIDFAVDEQGLWVIYATAANAGNIVISKLDPSNLAVTQTWNTTRSKPNSGNAFMICGTLWVTASYSSNPTTIAYKYDTATSQGSNVSIPFSNPGAYNSMIDYNPNDGLLYSWDNTRHMTYVVTF